MSTVSVNQIIVPLSDGVRAISIGDSSIYLKLESECTNSWALIAYFGPEILWSLWAVAGLFLLRRYARTRTSPQLVDSYYCVCCGYCLDATPNKCPECAATYTTLTRKRGSSVLWRLASPLSLLVIATSALMIGYAYGNIGLRAISSLFNWPSRYLYSWGVQHKSAWITSTSVHTQTIMEIDRHTGSFIKIIAKIPEVAAGPFACVENPSPYIVTEISGALTQIDCATGRNVHTMKRPDGSDVSSNTWGSGWRMSLGTYSSAHELMIPFISEKDGLNSLYAWNLDDGTLRLILSLSRDLGSVLGLEHQFALLEHSDGQVILDTPIYNLDLYSGARSEVRIRDIHTGNILATTTASVWPSARVHVIGGGKSFVRRTGQNSAAEYNSDNGEELTSIPSLVCGGTLPDPIIGCRNENRFVVIGMRGFAVFDKPQGAWEVRLVRTFDPGITPGDVFQLSDEGDLLVLSASSPRSPSCINLYFLPPYSSELK